MLLLRLHASERNTHRSRAFMVLVNLVRPSHGFGFFHTKVPRNLLSPGGWDLFSGRFYINSRSSLKLLVLEFGYAPKHYYKQVPAIVFPIIATFGQNNISTRVLSIENANSFVEETRSGMVVLHGKASSTPSGL